MKCCARNYSSSQIEPSFVGSLSCDGKIFELVSELVKCLLFLFFSSGCGGGGRGHWQPHVSPSVSDQRISASISAFGHQLRSSSLCRNTEFVRMLFYFPFPSPANVCFHSYRVSIPEQHWSRVFATLPGKRREGGGEKKGNAGIFQPGQPFSHATLAGRFAGMRRFHSRWKLEICASSGGGSRARLGGKQEVTQTREPRQRATRVGWGGLLIHAADYSYFSNVFIFCGAEWVMSPSRANFYLLCFHFWGEKNTTWQKVPEFYLDIFSREKCRLCDRLHIEGGKFQFSWNSLLFLLNENGVFSL